MTEKPAKVIGIDKGTLGVGKVADVTIIDPKLEYVIDTQKFNSKSKNCPYNGWPVKGKAVLTIVEGEIRFQSS